MGGIGHARRISRAGQIGVTHRVGHAGVIGSGINAGPDRERRPAPSPLAGPLPLTCALAPPGRPVPPGRHPVPPGRTIPPPGSIPACGTVLASGTIPPPGTVPHGGTVPPRPAFAASEQHRPEADQCGDPPGDEGQPRGGHPVRHNPSNEWGIGCETHP
jgi:hypothetical protein